MADKAVLASAKEAPYAGLMLTRRNPIWTSGAVAKVAKVFNQRFVIAECWGSVHFYGDSLSPPSPFRVLIR